MSRRRTKKTSDPEPEHIWAAEYADYRSSYPYLRLAHSGGRHHAPLVDHFAAGSYHMLERLNQRVLLHTGSFGLRCLPGSGRSCPVRSTRGTLLEETLLDGAAFSCADRRFRPDWLVGNLLSEQSFRPVGQYQLWEVGLEPPADIRRVPQVFAVSIDKRRSW
jgi:hypothetical protein